MKYIKLFEDYDVKEELRNKVVDWITLHKVNNNYKINDDLSVDLQSNDIIEGEIPFKINRWDGNLTIRLPKGAKILNFPNIVTGDFSLKANVENLEGCPVDIGERNDIWTGMGDLGVESCGLKSLKGAPKFIEGKIFITDNPCANDPMQLNYLPDRNVAEGQIFNKWYNEKSTFDIADGKKVQIEEGHYYKVIQSKLDEYWDMKLKEEPILFKHLEKNKDINSWFSNNISEKLYKKYEYLGRGMSSGLLDLKN